MSRIKGTKSSAALIVSVVALVAALGGGAVAGVAVTALNGKEKKQVRKIAKKQARKANKNAKAAQAAAEAAQGAADAAQSAADAANSELSCPDGTSLVDGSCIETSVREEANFATAENTCLAAGRRLPSRAELTAAVLEGIFSGPFELTNMLYVDDGVPGIAGISEAGETVALAADTPTPYRCVASAGSS